MKKILILRFSSLSHIIMSSAVIRNLKTQLGAEIHYATIASHAELLIANPYIDSLHTLENSFKTFIQSLQKEHFDFIIDLENNFQSRFIHYSLGIKSYRFEDNRFQKWLMVRFKIDKLSNTHTVDRLMETLQPLGVRMDTLGLDYFIPEKDEIPMEYLPETHRKGFVAFALGAPYPTRQLTLKRMIELCDRINKPVILLGGPKEQVFGEQIEQFFLKRQSNETYEEGLQALGKKTLIFNGCGKFSINQSASLIRQAIALFTHDHYTMHIGAAFKKHIFSMWGNTIPEFGNYPYRTSFHIFEKKGLSCRPCTRTGFNECPKGHFKCINDLVFDFYIPD